MNLGYIRGLVRKRLGETTAAFWQDSEINGYINDGLQDFAYRAKCVLTDSTFNAFGGQAEYGFNENLNKPWAITELYFYNIQTLKWMKLRSTSRTELDETNPGWLSAPNAVPNQFWWDRLLDTIYIFPPPDPTYISPQCMWAFYATQPPAVVNDSDIPATPLSTHLALVDYATAFGFDTRGWSDKAEINWQRYFKRIMDYETEISREREDDNIVMKSYKNRIHT